LLLASGPSTLSSATEAHRPISIVWLLGIRLRRRFGRLLLIPRRNSTAPRALLEVDGSPEIALAHVHTREERVVVREESERVVSRVVCGRAWRR
jgi:hypothetical protein